jgi:hypothetical protein
MLPFQERKKNITMPRYFAGDNPRRAPRPAVAEVPSVLPVVKAWTSTAAKPAPVKAAE